MNEPKRRSKAMRVRGEWVKIGKQFAALGTAQLGAALRVELTENPNAQLWESNFLTTVVFKRKRRVVKDWPSTVEELVDIVNELLVAQKGGWRFASEKRGEEDTWVWMTEVAVASAKKKVARKTVERVADVVGEQRAAVFDSECIESAADYESLVEILSSVTENVLAGLSTRCVEEGASRRLTLSLATITETVTLAGDTDYADVPRLLAGLNRVVERIDEARRFYEVRESGWRQEAGVAFATVEEAATLDHWGLLVSEQSAQSGSSSPYATPAATACIDAREETASSSSAPPPRRET